LDAGIAAVETKASRPVESYVPPVVEEKDDGHEETVEEVKKKMLLAQQEMDAGMARVNANSERSAKEQEMMPDMGALNNMTSTLHRMGQSK
jgi:hypothetical protein